MGKLRIDLFSSQTDKLRDAFVKIKGNSIKAPSNFEL